ncbi:hypothetical protein V6N11_016627 [Hibiscus sabdariffa]|uniref:MADS-box domain-containing protein n=1 Tax=Hibiscus sabdariffa TaxID=183260 RepID=A0ABR2TVQ8_9ROSI
MRDLQKINEITTLCGADILFICFSPAGKPFSFGHPSAESIAERFLDNNIPHSDNNTRHLVESHLKERINNIILQYNEINQQRDLNPQELEEHDSRSAELLNALYRTRSRKLAGTTVMPTPRDSAQLNPLPTNPNENVNAAFQFSSSRGPQD